ncbi:hypothetical protein OUE_0342 [Helicobacter pylori R030b]|nr:hypothetical protein OUE_0342 [Helicobacter pylori R030b]
MLFNLFKILFYRKTHFCKTHFLRGDNYQNQEALRILISKVFS